MKLLAREMWKASSSPLLPLASARAADSSFWISRSAMMRYSRSFARVTATYRTRISSALAERAISRRRASRGTVVYQPIPWGSFRLQAKPAWGWSSAAAFRSDRLKFRDRPQRNTTGNSSPLERWMLITRTTLACSEMVTAGARSLSCSWALSANRRNPETPRYPAFSYCRA